MFGFFTITLVVILCLLLALCIVGVLVICFMLLLDFWEKGNVKH